MTEKNNVKDNYNDEIDKTPKKTNIKTLGKKFSSSICVHGKPIGNYIFKPKRGEYYRQSLEVCNEVIKANEDMFGVIDENNVPHRFIIKQINRISKTTVMAIEIYKCDKSGQLCADSVDTKYQFTTFGLSNAQEKLIKEIIEKSAMSLQNLTVRSKKDLGFVTSCDVDKDRNYYFANEVGTIEIYDDEHGNVYFQIDGKRYCPSDAIRLFSPYCGFAMHYQIRNKTDAVLENDMSLMPIRINEDTLSTELYNLLYAFSEDHNYAFISYDDVTAFDLFFFRLLDKLKFYIKTNPRDFGKKAADKLIKMLENIETDDDMFPYYEIKLIEDALKDSLEE